MEKKSFTRFPQKVKKGIGFLIGAWIFFTLSQVVLHGTISFLHTTLGMLCCVMVYSIRNGGRIACIIYNMILIVAGLYDLYILAGAGMIYSLASAAGLINMILFAIATYYLLSRETASFYKKDPKNLPQEPE